MSENNEFYSDILILHKDGLYSVNGKQFKSLENAKTYIDTFLNLSDSPKISNSPKISESLTINDVINSIELKNYFGNKAEKWIRELTKLVEKKKLGDLEVNQKNLQKFLSVYKFSWLGLLFGSFWAAYHKSVYWWQIVIVFYIIEVCAYALFGLAGLFTMNSFFYAFLGKSLLLVKRADELKRTGKLNPASWTRVFILIISEIVLYMLILYYPYHF